ncbi:unnamed protein product [Rhodiola kirilowii]
MNRDWVSGSRLSVQYEKRIMDFFDVEEACFCAYMVNNM